MNLPKPFNRSILHKSLFLLLLGSIYACNSNTIKEEIAVFYLVRHAEKAQPIQMVELMQDASKDPELSEIGQQRAQKLKDLMLDKNISAIYSTNYKRTIQTVKPLSDSLELPIQLYEWSKVNVLLDSLVTETSGQQILFSGHSNTILPMISYLNGQKPQDRIGENEYDKIFKLSVFADTTLVEVTVY